ncbi:MAG: VWA domain-containing protein, partial [Chlamydiae bacterium]|nr:VWA domain-containing protein [Chlamydiota bacterium]
MSDVLGGKTGKKKDRAPVRPKPTKDDAEGRRGLRNLGIDYDELARAIGLTPEQVKTYLQWRAKIPQHVMRRLRGEINDFLEETTGQKIKTTDRSSAPIMMNPVADMMGEPGRGDPQKKFPQPITLIFLVDRSGSMAGSKEEQRAEAEGKGVTPVLKTRLILMLFLEQMIRANANPRSRTRSGKKVFRWEVIGFEGKTSLVSPKLEESEKVQKDEGSVMRHIYPILAGIQPRGWTEGRRSFAIGINETLKALAKDRDGIHVVLALTDFEFREGDASALKADLRAAQKQGVDTRVLPMGNSTLIANTLGALGNEFVIDTREGSELLPMLRKVIDELFIILESRTGARFKKRTNAPASYLAEGGQKEINPQLKRVLTDARSSDFGFVQGWRSDGLASETEEHRKGVLLDSL